MKLCYVLALVALVTGGAMPSCALATPTQATSAAVPWGIYLLLGGSWVEASTFCFYDDGHIFRLADNVCIGWMDEVGAIRDAEGNMIGMMLPPS